MVTARFKVSRLTPYGLTREEFDTALGEGKPVMAEVEMTPDYAGGRNSDWAAATPSGVFRMTVQNPKALEQLREGTALHIEITPTDE